MFTRTVLAIAALIAAAACRRNAVVQSPPAQPSASTAATLAGDTTVVGVLDVIAAGGAREQYSLVDSGGRRITLLDPSSRIGALGPGARAPGTRVRVTGSRSVDARGQMTIQIRTISLLG